MFSSPGHALVIVISSSSTGVLHSPIHWLDFPDFARGHLLGQCFRRRSRLDRIRARIPPAPVL